MLRVGVRDRPGNPPCIPEMTKAEELVEWIDENIENLGVNQAQELKEKIEELFGDKSGQCQHVWEAYTPKPGYVEAHVRCIHCGIEGMMKKL